MYATCEKPTLLSVPRYWLDAAIVTLEYVDKVNSAFLKSKNGDLAGVVANKSVSDKKKIFSRSAFL